VDNYATGIRDAIQSLLDSQGDGWELAQHVVVVALERIADGQVETGTWCWTPPGQAEWMTTGLLDAVIEARESIADY